MGEGGNSISGKPLRVLGGISSSSLQDPLPTCFLCRGLREGFVCRFVQAPRVNADGENLDSSKSVPIQNKDYLIYGCRGMQIAALSHLK